MSRQSRERWSRACLRFLVAYAMMFAVGISATGCSGACAEAKDLCETCELQQVANCDRFDDQSSDECEEAITTYENNCPDA